MSAENLNDQNLLQPSNFLVIISLHKGNLIFKILRKIQPFTINMLPLKEYKTSEM